MAKKKTITQKQLMSLYMDYVLEHGKEPASVYAFAKANNFEEALFYNHFGSFKAIEIYVFQAFYDHTVAALNKSEDYQQFDARNKLLSFYFTFFENLTANRSYVLYALSKKKDSMKNLKVLTSLKHSFTSYIDQLEIETLDIKEERLVKLQKQALKESAWIQLLLTMKFWMDDSSANFEKTDIYIEKSVNTSFDVMNITPVKSLIDFGKFIFKERVNTKI